MRIARGAHYLVLGGALALGGLAWGVPHWKFKLGLDQNSLKGEELSFDELEREGVILHNQAEDTYRRLEIKHELIEQLIEEHIALAEVIDGFEALNTDRPVVLSNLQNKRPGKSSREYAMINILSYLTARLSHEPTTYRRVMDRIERDWGLLQPETAFSSLLNNGKKP